MAAAVWHAARETLEEEEGMDLGFWHLQQSRASFNHDNDQMDRLNQVIERV